MAQQYSFENSTQTSVNFSTISSGDMFVYSEEPYIKLNNTTPNVAKIEDGTVATLEDNAQICVPTNRLIKFE